MEFLMLVVVVVCVFVVLMKWNDMRFCKRKGLPPGTMGWPIFGNNMEFLSQGPDFMKANRARYGNVFRAHVLGHPTVVSMDPELNRYILLNESKGLVPGYPQSILDILGKRNIAAVHGSDHKRLRGSLLSFISPPILKQNLHNKVDEWIRSLLHDLDGKTVDIQAITTNMAFYVSAKLIMDVELSSNYDFYKTEFEKLLVGTLSLPINLPGTKYHRGLMGRKNVLKLLREIMEERRRSKMKHDDMLDSLLRDEDPRYKLNDEDILDQIIMILNSGYETVSKTTMMAIKYLHDHPKALQQLRDEQLKIRERKKEGEAIDWEDYKSMEFTRAVIYETSRLATIVNGVLRKTTQEIELNGFVIPKGWRIYAYVREANHDPFLYPEPLTFDPWRYMQDKSLETHNYCFLFGGGTRLCPGKELGILKIATFLHYFVTNYKWEEIGGQKISKFPRVEAPNGLHLKISKY